MQKSPELAPRTTHGVGLYLGAFGEALHLAKNIADIGAGSSSFAQKFEVWNPGTEVWRYDAQYGDRLPDGDRWAAADVRNLDMVPDDTFDATVTTFMFQHLTHGNGDTAQAVKEMVRITKRVEDVNDVQAGNVMIFPIWKPEVMRKLLENFDNNIARMGYPDPDKLREYGEQMGDKETLLIRKTPLLTPDILDQLAHMIEESKALTKRETIVSLGRRTLIALTGNSMRRTHQGSDFFDN